MTDIWIVQPLFTMADKRCCPSSRRPTRSSAMPWWVSRHPPVSMSRTSASTCPLLILRLRTLPVSRSAASDGSIASTRVYCSGEDEVTSSGDAHSCDSISGALEGVGAPARSSMADVARGGGGGVGGRETGRLVTFARG